MAPTLRDIAKKAKVSYTAVSDILNRGKSGKYSDATISSVQRIAARMGYEANQAAKALKMGRTKTIGIVDPYGLVDMPTDPYFANVMMGVAARATAAGYAITVINTEGRSPDGPILPNGMFADGLIYLSLSRNLAEFKKEYVPRIRRQRIPGVVIHALTAPFACSSIGFDCAAGGYAVTDHLIRAHEYKEIGFMANTYPYPHHLETYRGYKRALTEAGLPVRRNSLYTSEGYSAPAAYAALDAAVNAGRTVPRALVCAADTLAYGAINCLRDHGLRVPDDVAVTGFGAEVSEHYLGAGLTTVDQRSRGRGSRAVDMVLARIKDGSAGDAPENVIMTPELIVRKTCGCA